MRRGWIIAVGLVALVAAALAWNTLAVDRVTKRARAGTGRLLRVLGSDVQVREDGPRAAPAIVLLHGFDASMRWWQPSVPALARRHHVIRIDLLGHGGSAKPRSGYSMEAQAIRVEGVLDRLHVRHAVVAGHSMGANVAVALAARAPDLVAGVVVIDQAARRGQGRLGLTARLGFVPVLGQLIYRVVPDWMVYDGFKEAFAPGYRYPRWVVEDYRAMTYSSYDQSAAADNAFVDRRPLDARLSATHKPALVIFGDRDQIANPGAWRTYRHVPGAVIDLIHGAGHSPMYEKPGPTTSVILAFARGREARGP